VVIEFDPRVVEYIRTRRVHPSQELVELANGGVRLSMTISDITEVTPWVLGFGETAKVIEPTELRERVQSELTNAIAQYAAPPKPSKKAASPAKEAGAKTARARRASPAR